MNTARPSAPSDTSTAATLSFEQIRTIVLALFFVSGASALIYEVAWVRLLSLAFGVSVYAVSAVLSAFMGGLALGAWLIGRLGARETAPRDAAARLLRLYALLQLGIALCALLSPLLVNLITGIYASLDQTSALDATASAALRFGLAVLALLVPTTLMGGTLPVMAQLLARGEHDRGKTLGALYAANTFGAVVGTLLAGLVLIRLLGTTAAIIVAAAGDLIIVAVAWWMAQGNLGEDRERETTEPQSRRTTEPGNDKTTGSRTRQQRNKGTRASHAQPLTVPTQSPIPDLQSPASSLQARIVLIGFALSGFVSLAYQVVWTRTLAIFSLNAVFSFSVMLATFLAGLAIGGALIAGRADRSRQPMLLFGGLQLAIGVSSIATLFVFSKLYTILSVLTLPDTLGGVIWAELLAAAITMFIPTLLIGATFPVAARVYAGGADVGARIGRLYAGNTLGAMLGSLAAGFALIPLLGLQRSALALASVNLIIGAAALLSVRPAARRTQAGLLGALAAAAVGALLLPPGVYLGFREGVIPALKYYKEGVDATVAVFEVDSPPLKISFVNGRNEVPTDAQSMRAFYILGHLPPLLRPDAERALVVSFGNGIATGSLATHPLKQITAVELVSGQVEAAGLLYTRENRGVLGDPRLQVVHEDGRNFLLRDRGSYDVITADATHPINSSSWALFTREFYTLVRARLAPDGVFIQWLPFHDLAAEDYRSIVKTFQSVFPNTTLFYTGGIHTFLVATPAPLTRAEIAALEERLQGTAAAGDLGSAAQLADDMLLDAQGVAAYTASAQVITDDRAFFLPGKDEGTILQSFAPYALR